MKFAEKIKSRKFLIAQQIVYLSIGVPILFNHLAIPEAITLMTLGVLSGAGTLYGVVSTWDKRRNGQDTTDRGVQ